MQRAECRLRGLLQGLFVEESKPLGLFHYNLYSNHKSSPWAVDVQIKTIPIALTELREALAQCICVVSLDYIPSTTTIKINVAFSE